jgi:predicted enzyme related to lactoylglutathione lyase
MAGKIVHFEIPAANAERAKAFWSGVFGWQFGDSAIPGMEYYMVRTGDDQGGAVLPSSGPFGVVVYFDTDDVDASFARVRESGGTAEDRMPIPNVGWFTHCKDTEGTEFSLFQSDESAG